MTHRERLIAFIEEYAMDEIENVKDALKIAKMSIKELEQNVDSIIAYYKETHKTIIKFIAPNIPTEIAISVMGYHPEDENGNVDESKMVYDFEEMANEFEQKLSELDDTAVVMCSIETK